jgi:D-alanine-D-alanine ligase
LFAKKFISDNIDFAFNYVPGDYGEDGRLSGFFEVLNIPYSHSGWFHHAVSIDKPIAKLLFREKGLDCAEGRLVSKEEILQGKALMNYPYIMKPFDSGSSLSTFLIKNDNDAS